MKLISRTNKVEYREWLNIIIELEKALVGQKPPPGVRNGTAIARRLVAGYNQSINQSLFESRKSPYKHTRTHPYTKDKPQSTIKETKKKL